MRWEGKENRRIYWRKEDQRKGNWPGWGGGGKGAESACAQRDRPVTAQHQAERTTRCPTPRPGGRGGGESRLRAISLGIVVKEMAVQEGKWWSSGAPEARIWEQLWGAGSRGQIEGADRGRRSQDHYRSDGWRAHPERNAVCLRGSTLFMGFPWWLSWWRIHIRLQCGRPGFHPRVGKMPGEGKGYPPQYSGLENPCGLYRPWGRKEWDTTERLSHSLHVQRGRGRGLTWKRELRSGSPLHKQEPGRAGGMGQPRTTPQGLTWRPWYTDSEAVGWERLVQRRNKYFDISGQDTGLLLLQTKEPDSGTCSFKSHFQHMLVLLHT